MSESIDISGLDKADVLCALYNNARAQGMGFLHFTPEPLSRAEALEELKRIERFDYLKGRVMKVDLSNNELHVGLYDRDNGEGSSASALSELITKRDTLLQQVG